MKTCQLFGDQCFKRNMVYTIVNLSLFSFYRNSSGYYYSPSQSILIDLAGRLPPPIPWQYKDVDIYYARGGQAATAKQELRRCLFVFELQLGSIDEDL